MPTKYIDLDAIDVPMGEITYEGQVYEVNPPSLRILINISTLERKGEDIQEEDLKQMAEIIHQMTDIPFNDLMNMPFSKLQILFQFISDLGGETTEGNSTAPEGAPMETPA